MVVPDNIYLSLNDETVFILPVACLAIKHSFSCFAQIQLHALQVGVNVVLIHNGGSCNACIIQRSITLLCIPKKARDRMVMFF
jgi:hypothetical protein